MMMSDDDNLVESFENLTIQSSASDDSLADKDYIPTPKLNKNLIALNDFLKDVQGRDVSPVRSQSHVPIEEMAPSTIRYYKKKSSQVCEAALHCIAPGQSSALLELIKRESEHVTQQNDSELVKRLISLYEESDSWATQREVLSLFAHDYTKSQLKEMIPGVTKSCIDEARKHAAREGPGKPVELPKVHRSRMDPVKVDHFVDFISRPDYLQDVAFGMKKLKLENGEEIEIPNVVRTVTASRLVKLYTSFCKESDFEPLGRSTLFNILNVRKCSQKNL